MLSESARMSSAAEARFRVPAPASVARVVKVVALEPGCDDVLVRLSERSWNGVSFFPRLSGGQPQPGAGRNDRQWRPGGDGRGRGGRRVGGCAHRQGLQRQTRAHRRAVVLRDGSTSRRGAVEDTRAGAPLVADGGDRRRRGLRRGHPQVLPMTLRHASRPANVRRRRSHHESIAFVDNLLRVAGVHVRDVRTRRRSRQQMRRIAVIASTTAGWSVLSGIPEVLRQVALANQHDADAAEPL